jgi:hypothetical protein
MTDGTNPVLYNSKKNICDKHIFVYEIMRMVFTTVEKWIVSYGGKETDFEVIPCFGREILTVSNENILLSDGPENSVCIEMTDTGGKSLS